MARSYQIGLRRVGAIAGIAGGGGGVLPVPKFTTCAGGICPETAGIAEIPGEFAYMKLPRGAICNASGGIASKGGVLPGPGTPFAYSRGGICPETAGIAEMPGEFAYTTPLQKGAGAICNDAGGVVSYQGCLINSTGGG
jgi:hypothetical protein